MNDNNTVLEQVFEDMPEEFRMLNEYEAKTMLSKLGMNNYEQKIGALSGGQKKRTGGGAYTSCRCSYTGRTDKPLGQRHGCVA